MISPFFGGNFMWAVIFVIFILFYIIKGVYGFFKDTGYDGVKLVSVAVLIFSGFIGLIYIVTEIDFNQELASFCMILYIIASFYVIVRVMKNIL